MPSLKCNVKSCVHNSDNKCCLEVIQVEGINADNPTATACGSFKLRSDRNATNSFKNSINEKPSEHVAVDCKAQKCVFNSECKCTAKDIGISGHSACTCRETECASFSAR
ncbi:MAG: DUF1540 domain-containing protein [Lachnospiraceae bacterium]|nr:DUF1540 domain-containing protein [Lachnospiraceae bacterium]